MPPTRQGPRQSTAVPVVAVSVVAALVATWFGYPGVVVAWLGCIIAAFGEPPVELTGQKVAGRPTPLDEREDTRLESFRLWQSLRTSLLPGVAWFPGWPPLASWFAAVATAALAWHLPADIPQLADVDPRLFTGANTLAAFALVVGWSRARRQQTGSPGIRLDSTTKAPRGTVVVGAGAGLLIGLALGLWGLPTIGHVQALATRGMAWEPEPVLVAACALLGLSVGLAAALRTTAIGHHLEVHRRNQTTWVPLWRSTRTEPAPRLVDTEQVGPVTVDTFETRAGAAEVLKAAATKIGPALGAGLRVGYLTSPNVAGGQPVPGTVHPNRFQVTQAPSDQWPDTMDPALDPDLRQVAVRTEWQPRWKPLKLDPAPELVSSVAVGPARVDTFEAVGGIGAEQVVALGSERLGPALGPSVRAALLHDFGDGTQHPTRFRVVSWPADSLPRVTDPGVPQDVLVLLIDSALAWVMEPARMPVPRVSGMERVSSGGDTTLWRLDLEGGPGWKSLRRDGFAGMLAETLGAEQLVDHSPIGGLPRALYLGDLGADGIDDSLNGRLEQLDDEDLWHKRWDQTLKLGQYPPELQHAISAQMQLHQRNRSVTVERHAFAPLQGLDPTEFHGLEAKLTTTMAPSPFMTICGFCQVPGVRHDQLFTVYHASQQVPTSADKLLASPTNQRGDSAARWVLTGMVNQAFKAARRSLPEVVRVRNMVAVDDQPRHNIWEVCVQPYGGDTLADIRGVREKLRASLQVPWLRIADGGDGRIMLYMGSEPAASKLANPRKDQPLVDDLDWTQAFIDSGVSSRGGQLPRLTSSATMPSNDQVKVLDFDLPPGLALGDVRDKVERLRSAVGCEYVAPMAIRGEASRMRVQCSVADPMPRRVDFDYAAVTASKAIPFGQAVDGEPVIYDWKDSVHAMVVGGSGSGKSALLQMMLVGAAVRGAELFIGDPTKGAADFRFLEPWARSITTTLSDTVAMMRGVYDETLRRKELNSKYAVGSYRDLPDDVRPRHLVMVIDEFTSLIIGESVSRTAFDDEEMEAERQAVLANNAMRIEIGQIAGKIGREARSAGVTMWLGAQKLSASIMDKIPGGDTLKLNLGRILLGMTTWGDRASALRMPDFAPDLGTDVPIGRGLYESSVASSVAFHGYYDSTDNLAKYLRESHVPEAEPFDLSPFVRKTATDEPRRQVVVVADAFADGDEPLSEEVVVDEGFSLDHLGDVGEVGDGGLDLSALADEWGSDESADPLATDDPFVTMPGPAADPLGDDVEAYFATSPEHPEMVSFEDPVAEGLRNPEPEPDPWGDEQWDFDDTTTSKEDEWF